MEQETNQIKILLQDVVMAIVPDDAAVLVKSEAINEEQKTVTYKIYCNPADARFLIGKAGVNATAIKAIARAAGQKLGIKAEVVLDVPNKK